MQFGRLISSVFVVFAAFAVAGCASVANKVDPAALSGKSISVTSQAGDSIRYLWIGTTVFNNEVGSVAFPDGKLDRAIEEATAQALRSTNRYSSVSIAPPKVDTARERLGSIGADYLLLVGVGSSVERWFNTGQSLVGFGLFQRSLLGLRPVPYGHAAVDMTLIKTSTGEVIAQVRPMETWPSDVVLASGPSLSAADTAAFQATLLQRGPTVVTGALQALGLR